MTASEIRPRVLRGGGFTYRARSSARFRLVPGCLDRALGFRLVMPEQVSYRVRGGSSYSCAILSRASYRGWRASVSRANSLGVRLVIPEEKRS